MTATGTDPPPAGAAPAPALVLTAISAVRMAWLYLTSRRVQAATSLLAAVSAVLWAALHWHWSIVEGAAAIIAVTSYGPLGDTERAAAGGCPACGYAPHWR